MKKIKQTLFIVIVMLIHNYSYGQYSFITIEDSIVLDDSNCACFENIDTCVNEYLLSFLSVNNLSVIEINNIDYNHISLIVNDYNCKLRDTLKNSLHEFQLKQTNIFEDYAFQIYPIRDSLENKYFLTIIILKKSYKYWKIKPIFRYDGNNTFYILGLIETNSFKSKDN